MCRRRAAIREARLRRSPSASPGRSFWHALNSARMNRSARSSDSTGSGALLKWSINHLRRLDAAVTLPPRTGGRRPEVVQSRARAAQEHVTHKPGPLFREGYRSPGEGCRACAGTSGVLFCNRYLGRQVNAAVEITGTGDAQPSAILSDHRETGVNDAVTADGEAGEREECG